MFFSGQILINECLQKDLREVICGLQEYLRGLRLQVTMTTTTTSLRLTAADGDDDDDVVAVLQAHGSQQKLLHLQAENRSLQLHLEDTQRHCRNLEDTTKTHTQVTHRHTDKCTGYTHTGARTHHLMQTYFICEFVCLQKLCVQQRELSLLRREALALRDRQVEQEAELQRLREELRRQVTLGHVMQSHIWMSTQGKHLWCVCVSVV